MTTRQMIKRFLEPITSSKINFFLSLCCGLMEWLVATYIVIFLKYITDAIQKNDILQVKYRAIIRSVTITLWFILRVFYKTVPFRLIRDIHSSIYASIMKVYFQGNNTKIEKIGSWRIISLLQKWLFSWIHLIFILSRDVAARLFTTLLIFYQVGKANIWIMTIWVCMLIFCLGRIYTIYPKALVWRKKWKHVDTEIDRLVVLHVMNKFEIYQQNKSTEETNKITEKNNEWCYYKTKEKFWQWISYDGTDYITHCVVLILALYYAYQILHGHATFGDFILFTWLGWLLADQITKFLGIMREFADNHIHIEKLYMLVDSIYEPDQNNIHKPSLIWQNGNIHIQNLSFCYEDWSTVFDMLSLSLQWWRKTALVWPSGWGKSTLLKLIAGYMKPDTWSIVVDEQNLQDISLITYYSHIGYLTQEPSVFDGTVRENLLYGVTADAPLVSKEGSEMIEKIITLAKCEFIYDFPHGLDTEIGEKWVRLSWWQRQRLAIAKIMLKNPDIILLDEPTSALDSYNEEQVTIALNNLFAGRTVIIIAHRLQTVKHADDIIYIADGKVIERWTHDELLKLKGEYYTMVELQSGF